MSTSLTFEAGVDKQTNQHPIAFSALTLLVGRQEEHPACNQFCDEMVAWRGNVQMIRVWSSGCHSIVSCFTQIRDGSTFLVPAYPGCPEKEAVKRVSLSVLSTVNPIVFDYYQNQFFNT